MLDLLIGIMVGIISGIISGYIVNKVVTYRSFVDELLKDFLMIRCVILCVNEVCVKAFRYKDYYIVDSIHSPISEHFRSNGASCIEIGSLLPISLLLYIEVQLKQKELYFGVKNLYKELNELLKPEWIDIKKICHSDLIIEFERDQQEKLVSKLNKFFEKAKYPSIIPHLLPKKIYCALFIREK